MLPSWQKLQPIPHPRATLDQVVIPDPDNWKDTLEWFRTLPLWINLKGIRAVHACWDEFVAARLSCGISLFYDTFPIPEKGYFLDQERLTDWQLKDLANKSEPYGAAVERLLCGPELKLPKGKYIETPDGKLRGEIRYRWWEGCTGKSYREMVFPANEDITTETIIDCPEHGDYAADEPLTFFGHYAIQNEPFKRLERNLACLDFGMGKGGRIVSYSCDGEAEINPSKFTSISQRKDAHE
jgi:hypothetical protein